ncbi:Kiwa anti-phage protein KwaB-like domain-containing protein [Planococcus sp. FY231025]|uniref:Kiwa anti-phage protein KwaB-like domain-containing protein n=1 Tax=Planococcus sp. FY231025 TaxID=3455699 RepID=UPI003F8E2526
MIENELTNKIENFFSKEITDTKIYLIFRSVDDETNEYLYSSSYFGFKGKDYETFKEDYVEYLIEAVKDKELTEYDIAVTEKGSIETIPSSHVPNLTKVKEVLSPPESRTIIEDRDFDPVKIWGYVIVMKNKDDKVIRTYRKQVNAKLMKESKVLNFLQGEVKIIKSDDRLILDFKADAIEFEDKCFVTNNHYFNQFFSYTEAHVNYANANFDGLKEIDIIENFDDFHSRCIESVTLVKRLVAVIKEDRLTWLKDNFSKAKKVATDYGLKIEFDGDKIKYNSKNCNISDVITLIRGGCVTDAVDMERYIASSVRKIGSTTR